MYANLKTKIPKHRYTNPKTWMLSHQDEKKKELARTVGEDQAVLSDAKTRSILGIPLLHTNQCLLHGNPSFYENSLYLRTYHSVLFLFVLKTHVKGRFQKLLSRFFPLRGYPRSPLPP